MSTLPRERTPRTTLARSRGRAGHRVCKLRSLGEGAPAEGEPQSGEEQPSGERGKPGADLDVLLLDCDVLRQVREHGVQLFGVGGLEVLAAGRRGLSLIHISEPTRRTPI